MADRTKDALEFVMEFVAASETVKSQYQDRWLEVAANFIVEPEGFASSTGERSPYTYNYVYRPKKKKIILKDPETHKLVMTYAAKLMLSVFGDTRGEYIQAAPVGYEDAPQKAPTVTKLMRYAFALPGVYRTFLESVVDMIQFGTSVIELYWRYDEMEMPVRQVSSQYGVEVSEESRVRMPVYDDVCITPVDITDFFPDPAQARIDDMSGCAKRFRMSAAKARRMIGMGYDPAAVERAIRGGSDRRDAQDDFRKGYGKPFETTSSSKFREMTGYDYWGDVEWTDNLDGASRRCITVLNREVVRDIAYPLGDPHLPFHALIINPMQGRFYGLAPAEIVRWDQSFADAIKILLAEAIIRQVHPPIAFDPASDLDTSALAAWKPDALISARGGPAAAGTLNYNANVANGFAMLQGLKNSMQESSGALGAIAGEPGPSREAASVGVRRLEYAMDRPELAAALLERECLPPIGKAILRRYQQFLRDTSDLQKRVGELPEPAWIGDIMGDFDIQFTGSRQAMSRQQRLQAWQTLATMAQSIPAFQAMIPWDQLAQKLIGEDLELPDVAAVIGDPKLVAVNAMLMQALGGGRGPANNGVGAAPQPAGQLTEQAAGAEA